ncbi:hypothetical protein [Pedobacter sp. ASV28]|uniref:hypothetical protein n=1 Tax=Pedobacter sp. ASV28 TaxID=2795123 RepID=UPI0018EC5FE0|nr:hypothetical protein [Pedobacter sp. ASV28]
MINKKTAPQQAKVYVYELGNCAKEFGFKADEGWELSAASDAEKMAIEKRYHPVISVKVLPEILSEFFDLVNDTLMQLKSGITNTINPGSLLVRESQYLVAYNPKRLIR